MTRYRVSSEARRRRILLALDRIADPGMVAADTDDHHVVIEAAGATAHLRGRRIVQTLDPRATVVEPWSTPADLWVDDPADVVEWSRR